MKFGFRMPNLIKRIAARTSWKIVVRDNLGFKSPKGMGWVTDPKNVLYNRIYNRTTTGFVVMIPFLISFLTLTFFMMTSFFHH